MKRRLVTLSLILALALTACGQTSTPTQTQSTPAPETTQTTPVQPMQPTASATPTTPIEPTAPIGSTFPEIDPYSNAVDASDPSSEYEDYDPYEDPYYALGLGGVNAYSSDEGVYPWQYMYMDYTHDTDMSDDRRAYRCHCYYNTLHGYGSIGMAEAHMFDYPEDDSFMVRGATVAWVDRSEYQTTILAKTSTNGTVFEVSYPGVLTLSENSQITVFGSLVHGGSVYTTTDQYNRTTEHQCAKIDCRDIIINADYNMTPDSIDRILDRLGTGTPVLTDFELSYWFNRQYEDSNGNLHMVTPSSVDGCPFTVYYYGRNTDTGDLVMVVRYDGLNYLDDGYTYIIGEWDELHIHTRKADSAAVTDFPYDTDRAYHRDGWSVRWDV